MDGKKVRARRWKNQAQVVLDSMTVLLEDTSLKAAKKGDILQSKLAYLQSAMLMESEEKKIKAKFGDVEQLQSDLAQARAEITRLRGSNTTVPVANIEESFEARLARLKEVQS